MIDTIVDVAPCLCARCACVNADNVEEPSALASSQWKPIVDTQSESLVVTYGVSRERGNLENKHRSASCRASMFTGMIMASVCVCVCVYTCFDSRAVGYRFGKHINDAVTLAIQYCQKAGENDDDLREYCLQVGCVGSRAHTDLRARVAASGWAPRTHTHTHMHTHTHTHTHTRMQTYSLRDDQHEVVQDGL
jgi:hypothetical protein